MSTNKVILRTTEEFMADYQPIYQPIFPLLMGKSQSYSQQVGQVNFQRLEAIGDIRNKHITPKDTEIFQINAGPSSKSFKKYFLASQFTVSQYQDQEGTEDVIAQVLDENNKYMDEIIVTGEGTAPGNVVNNGLYFSSDANYTLNTSVEIQKDSNANYLSDLYAQVAATAAVADNVSGRKLIVFYGSIMLPQFNGLYLSSTQPFKMVMQNGLGANYNMTKLPSDVTPAGANGWMILNLDQVKLHYTVLPELAKQGSNDEKDYNWFNFLMGSAMVEVLTKNAIIRQPATLEA